MNEDAQPRQHKYKRIWLALTALAVLLAILIVPPLVSVSRYKSRITRLISTSLGRPVRLSSVEVRLLPRPGFVLNDLTVEEDPAYGLEPVLHANTVTASIRLLSLWRGHLEIDSISADEASLNLVRTTSSRWNLDPLLRSATNQAQSAAAGGLPGKTLKLPYLEATNSRINIKNGTEKLPFSLLNAEMSLWQESPGNWRVRLRGEPVRTDLSLEQADTGIVRLEANLHQAPQLRQMLVHLNLEWREAQLGQLTRLILGSDAGWRGDLTGELQLDGSADAAQIKARLRATGVHRAEFAPVAAMDFDANCSLVAHFSTRAIDNLLCDSPLGNGRIRLAGDLPGEAPGGTAALPHISVELDKIPVAAGLDALRTVRSSLAPGLDAAGSVSGKITYAPSAPETAEAKKPAHFRALKAQPGPLTGGFTVAGLAFSGKGLSQPILIPKLLLEPAPASANQAPDAPQALVATVALPGGAAEPLNLLSRFALSGYQISARGQASILRARELAHLAGLANAAALDAVAGDALTVDLTAEGPWMPAPTPALKIPPAGLPLPKSGSLPQSAPLTDSITGTVTLRNANWKADYLVNAVQISQATLHIDSGAVSWDPVVFSYGPLKGTASLTQPAACEASMPCVPHFEVQLGALDAAILQNAFLGAKERTTMLSTLIDRLRSSAAPALPQLEGTVKAESLLLGPVTLHEPSATLSTVASEVQVTAFDAGLLGGHIHGSGTLLTPTSPGGKPAYALEGELKGLSSQAVGQLIGLRATGGVFDGSGKIALSGFTGDDLAASAKGSLHFEWQHGRVVGGSGASAAPASLARFDHWTGDAEIADGAVTLKDNQLKRGGVAAQPVLATVPLAEPAKISFDAAKPANPAHK
jgi:hypothetical protein